MPFDDSLTKDMNSKEDLFRASAVRALCKITDVSILLSNALTYNR